MVTLAAYTELEWSIGFKRELVKQADKAGPAACFICTSQKFLFIFLAISAMLYSEWLSFANYRYRYVRANVKEWTDD